MYHMYGIARPRYILVNLFSDVQDLVDELCTRGTLKLLKRRRLREAHHVMDMLSYVAMSGESGSFP